MAGSQYDLFPKFKWGADRPAPKPPFLERVPLFLIVGLAIAAFAFDCLREPARILKLARKGLVKSRQWRSRRAADRRA